MTLLLATLAAHAAEPLVAVVVVDQEARESGYALQLDGWLVDDPLPVDVVEGDQLVLVGPEGHQEPLDVAAGEAWEVTGPDGEAWMSTLGDDVRTDLVAVRAPYETVRRLAEVLSAEIEVRDGVTYLAGPDVLYDVPWVEGHEARDLEEVRFVGVDELGAEVASERTASRARLGSLPATGAASRALAAPTPTPRAPTSEVAEVPRPVAAAAAATPTPEPVAEPTASDPDPDPVSDPVSDPDPGADRMDDHLRYAGMYLCRDQQLYLHPAGVYVFAGQQGEWTVGAPGVARLKGPDGELWYRAAIDPDRSFCREVWTEEDVLRGAAPPQRQGRGLKLFGPR